MDILNTNRAYSTQLSVSNYFSSHSICLFRYLLPKQDTC